jgi:hypothetical protein
MKNDIWGVRTMQGLGDLGFWLAVGAALAAMIVSGALKERDKERERQATLRALLEKGGEGATAVLAYLRERDAAEAARAHAKLNVSPTGGAVVVVAFSIFVGALAYTLLAGPGTRSFASFTMFAIWIVGLVVAGLVFVRARFGKHKNDAQRDA